MNLQCIGRPRQIVYIDNREQHLRTLGIPIAAPWPHVYDTSHLLMLDVSGRKAQIQQTTVNTLYCI